MGPPRLLRYYIGGVIKIYYNIKGGGLPNLLQYYNGGGPRDPKFVLRNIWTAPYVWTISTSFGIFFVGCLGKNCRLLSLPPLFHKPPPSLLYRFAVNLDEQTNFQKWWRYLFSLQLPLLAKNPHPHISEGVGGY